MSCVVASDDVDSHSCSKGREGEIKIATYLQELFKEKNRREFRRPAWPRLQEITTSKHWSGSPPSTRRH